MRQSAAERGLQTAGRRLALSDGTGTDEALDTVAACTTQSAHAYLLRSPERTASFLTGLEPVEPGIVPTVAWRPDAGRPEEGTAEVSVRGVALTN
ncbi:SAM-dependent methyltransferase [Streptomyces griseoviridis]|uniref:SAM-dependent methyltransferase n=1 Tax=Streptomyces griseoviridis TaxID=45398 RepID=UPI0027D82567|nr:SAM-dependent methyltransferase [Streptomyces griseoviridis]